VENTSGEPSYGPGWLSRPGARILREHGWESAHMYNDSNSLGDRAKKGRGSERRHAGTGEGISARIHVVNSHGDRAEQGRRSDLKHSANSLWEGDESCMSVGASIASQSRCEMFNRSWKSIVIMTKKKLRRQRTASVAVTGVTCHESCPLHELKICIFWRHLFQLFPLRSCKVQKDIPTLGKQHTRPAGSGVRS